MINYIEKGHRLHEYILSRGYRLIDKGDAWYSSNDVAVQSIIDDYDELAEAKKDARKRVTLEASKLVAIIYPFINPEKGEAIGLYHFTTDLYLSIKPASRNNLSGRLLDFENIYNAAQVAISDINIMTDWQVIDAYDSVNTPIWP